MKKVLGATIIRENQLKEIEYLKEAGNLLTNIHEILKKAHEHLSNRVNEKHEEIEKLYKIVTKEKNK
jgi:hypothetical protein